jgi:putative endonuclease
MQIHSSLHYVYILRCSDQSLYVAVCEDFEKDLALHNQGKGTRYTCCRLPVSLAIVEGPFSLKEAVKREEQLKSWSPEKKIRLIERNKRVCCQLRQQILAFGGAVDAIGGPPDPNTIYSAQELRRMLSFIRYDVETDLASSRHRAPVGARRRK